MVTVKAVTGMNRPVTLAYIKAEESLADMALVRQPRLSVIPVTAEQWDIILQMGDTVL